MVCFIGNDSLTLHGCSFYWSKRYEISKQLISGGSEHRKFLRQIQVSVDITAPPYIGGKNLILIKVGTVANSTFYNA